MSEGGFDYKEAIARLDELNASYSFSEDVQQNSRDESESSISDFVRKYNEKTGSSVSTLDDILEQCNIKCNIEESNLKYENDVLRSQLEDRRQEVNALKKKARKLESALLKLNQTIKKGEIEQDALKTENETLKSECHILQDRFQAAQHELELIKQGKDSTDTTNALERVKAILQSEIEQKMELTKQRDKLLSLLNRQTQLMSAYDKTSRVSVVSSQKTDEKANEDNINDDYDVLYTTLGAVVRLASRVQGFEEVVSEIKSNSSLSVNERIVEIVKRLTSKVDGNREASKARDDTEAKRQIEEAQQRSLRLLSVLEEEIDFIRRLSDSDSLQSIVFLSMNERDRSSVELKKFLVEHCAKIGHFIEQSLPRVSVCSTLDELQSLKVDTAHVFDLLKPVNLSEKIEFASKFAPECRELFDLFVAGVTMSSLVYRQYNEMKIRLDRAQVRVQELHSLADSAMTYRNELKEHEEKEMEIRSIVGRVFDASPRCDIVDLISAVMKYFTEDKKINSEKKSVTQNHEQEIETFKESEKQLQLKLEETQSQLLARDNTINDMNRTITSQKERIQILTQKLEENNSLLNERMKQKDLREAMLQKECKSKERLLQKCVVKIEAKLKEKEKKLADSQSELVIAKTHQSRLEADIAELKSQSEVRLREQKLAFERTTTDLRTQIAKLRSDDKESQVQARQLQIHNAELQSQNSKLKTELETLNLQYQSQESRIKNEITNIKSQLELQKTTLCSENERQTATVLSFLEQLFNVIGKPTSIDSNTNIREQFTNIVEEVELIVADRKRCVNEIRSIEKIKQVLKVKPEENLIQAVVRLLESYQATLEDKDRMTTQLNDQDSTIELLRKYEHETEGKLVALRQWDIWSRRLLRIRRGMNPESLGQDEVRLLLEEDLLMGSLSTDALRGKLNMLRFEKQIMEPFVDWRRFKTISKEPEWRPLLVLVRFVVSQMARSGRQDEEAKDRTRNRRNVDLSPVTSQKVSLPGIDTWEL